MSTATETQDNGAYANLKRLEAQGYSFRIPTYMDPVWHSVDAMVADMEKYRLDVAWVKRVQIFKIPHHLQRCKT